MTKLQELENQYSYGLLTFDDLSKKIKADTSLSEIEKAKALGDIVMKPIIGGLNSERL